MEVSDLLPEEIMPSGISVPLTIQVFQGQKLVRTETLTQDIIKIGKLSSSHLQLDDESVSRMHAVIEISPSREVTIVDLGSTKGTFVNRQRINKARLSSGDEVLIGDVRLLITMEQRAAEPAAAAEGRVAEEQRPIALPRPTAMGLPMAAPSAPLPAIAVTPPAPPAFAAPPPVPMNVPPPVAIPSPYGTRAPAPMAPPIVAVPPHIAEQVELRDGSTAVEVSAMFEDAVLAVRHLDNPAGGQLTGATRGIIGSAVAALGTLFVIFLVSFVQMANLTQQKEAWEKAGKPINEFPKPPREGPARDAAGVVLLVYGLGALVYGLGRRADELRENEFTIGPAPEVTFSAPGDGLPVGRFPLVRSTGADYELLFTMSMSGDMESGGRSQSLSELSAAGVARPSSAIAGAFSLPIQQGARINLRYGDNTFNINSVPRPRSYPVPFAVDWSTQSYTGGVFLFAALFLLMIFSVPPDPKSLSLDAFMNDQRLAKFLVKPEENKDELVDWLKKNKEENSGGKRAKENEGKMGKKDAPVQKTNFAIKGPKTNVDIQLAKQQAQEAAKNAGVLGILNGSSPGMSSIFGRDSALGRDAEDAMGGLLGTEVGDAFGGGAMGIVGAGGGGGGTGEGTVGLGNLGTIGRGGGAPGGGSYGKGVGNLRKRGAAAPDVVPGTAEVKGSLDKEVIRRVIRKHINEVKFCYEKELTRNQALQGRVMIQFTISPTGSVVSSVVQSSTMGNSSVDQCIAAAVKRWEFPKPQGGIVIVSYPFVLKAADAN